MGGTQRLTRRVFPVLVELVVQRIDQSLPAGLDQVLGDADGSPAVVLVADQLTKLAIVAHLPFPTYGEGYGAITVIRNFFYIVHVGNTGAAWSMFSGQSVLLAIFALVTLAAIVNASAAIYMIY